MSKKMCRICRIRPATRPDRNRPGRPVKAICDECYAQRLMEDMKYIKRKNDEEILSKNDNIVG
jgi:hypothetical protein